jgi:uncharacterized protein with NAD-binding domain and iron-sulfur cluster
MTGKKKVLVIGAGVGGLTAAHELAERGYEVTVIEQDHFAGGKSATQYPLVKMRGRPVQVPAEHGFRLFPSFYKHVIETMQRIPFDRDREPRRGADAAPAAGERRSGRRYDTVADNLVPTTHAAMIRHGFAPQLMPRSYGADLDGMIRLLGDSLAGQHFYSSSETDLQRFQLKTLQFLTSCSQRRDSIGRHGYGALSWWDFVGAAKFSPRFQNELDTFVRTMVAMDARNGNARTVGNVGMQLLLDLTGDGSKVDRVFNGPTSDQWLLPWVDHLHSLGVNLQFGYRVVDLRYDRARRNISGVRVVDPNGVTSYRRIADDFDHVVAAVPIEGMQRILSRSGEDLFKDDPALSWIRNLDIERYTAWMSGIQFYLEQDVPIVRGHVYYPEAQWRLSSVSQAQFWGPNFGGVYGNARPGTDGYRGILSVDICDWEHSEGSHTAGAFQRVARECDSSEDVAAEIWEQLRWSLTSDGRSMLPDRYLAYHLDDYIRFPAKEPRSASEAAALREGEVAKPTGLRPRVGTKRLAYNNSPYFIHPPGSHLERPTADTTLRNLFLAADYVRSTTDLSSMEGANEAARRAVNAILAVDRLDGGQGCQLYDFHEPAQLQFIKDLDRDLFTRGEPHPFVVLGLADQIERAGSSVAANGVLSLALSSLKTTQVLSGAPLGLTRIP